MGGGRVVRWGWRHSSTLWRPRGESVCLRLPRCWVLRFTLPLVHARPRRSVVSCHSHSLSLSTPSLARDLNSIFLCSTVSVLTHRFKIIMVILFWTIYKFNHWHKKCFKFRVHITFIIHNHIFMNGHNLISKYNM